VGCDRIICFISLTVGSTYQLPVSYGQQSEHNQILFLPQSGDSFIRLLWSPMVTQLLQALALNMLNCSSPRASTIYFYTLPQRTKLLFFFRFLFIYLFYFCLQYPQQTSLMYSAQSKRIRAQEKIITGTYESLNNTGVHNQTK